MCPTASLTPAWRSLLGISQAQVLTEGPSAAISPPCGRRRPGSCRCQLKDTCVLWDTPPSLNHYILFASKSLGFHFQKYILSVMLVILLANHLGPRHFPAPHLPASTPGRIRLWPDHLGSLLRTLRRFSIPPKKHHSPSRTPRPAMSGPTISLITLLQVQPAPHCPWSAVGMLCSEAFAPTGPPRAPLLRCSQGSSPEFLYVFPPSHSQASLAAFSIIPTSPFPALFFLFST